MLYKYLVFNGNVHVARIFILENHFSVLYHIIFWFCQFFRPCSPSIHSKKSFCCVVSHYVFALATREVVDRRPVAPHCERLPHNIGFSTGSWPRGQVPGVSGRGSPGVTGVRDFLPTPFIGQGWMVPQW